MVPGEPNGAEHVRSPRSEGDEWPAQRALRARCPKSEASRLCLFVFENETADLIEKAIYKMAQEELFRPPNTQGKVIELLEKSVNGFLRYLKFMDAVLVLFYGFEQNNPVLLTRAKKK